MALASIDDTLNHELRFLLFEIGIFIEQAKLEAHIKKAERLLLYYLDSCCKKELLCDVEIKALNIHDYLHQLETYLQKKDMRSRFWQWDVLHQQMRQGFSHLSMYLAYLCGRQTPYSSSFISHHQKNLFLTKATIANAIACLNNQHAFTHALLPLSKRELLQYSPLFQSQVNLPWLAIHRSFANVDAQNYIYFMEKSFPQELALWQEHLYRQHLPLHDYLPLPVHPWQWREKIKKTFKEHLQEGLLLPPFHCQKAMPFHAMDIFQPMKTHAPFVITSCDVQSVEPNYFFDDAIYDTAITLLAKEKHIKKSYYLLETLSFIKAQHSQSTQLTTYFKKTPISYIDKNEKEYTLCQLLSPFNNTPLLFQCIKKSQLAPIHYFKEYCYVLLNSPLTLWLKYGLFIHIDITTSLFVFEKEKLSKQIGIKIKNIYLLSKGGLFTQQTKEIKGAEEIIQYFIETYFHYHLQYIIDSVHNYFSIDKNKLWYTVQKTILKIINALVPQCESTALIFMQTVFNQAWKIPSPTTALLANYQNAPNYMQNPWGDAISELKYKQQQ